MIVPAVMTMAALWLVYLVIGSAFQPLTLMAAQFRQIGAGDYTGRIAEKGAPEIADLQRGFNRMAAELSATTERNRFLTEQMAKLQEEERAEIARDLHDEIGPHLFAVNLDAETITQLCEAGRFGAVPERARDIQSAVQNLQRHVRELLGRLRPTQVTEFGLAVAIEELVRFWSTRHAGMTFEVDLATHEFPQTIAELVYRVVQEAVNNAVRHGKPRTIRICIEARGDREIVVEVINDGQIAAPGGAKAQATRGLGLIGMRERIEASGGTLSYGPRSDCDGWAVTAYIPWKSALIRGAGPQAVEAGT